MMQPLLNNVHASELFAKGELAIHPLELKRQRLFSFWKINRRFICRIMVRARNYSSPEFFLIAKSSVFCSFEISKNE
jgi:hypothetical protein